MIVDTLQQFIDAFSALVDKAAHDEARIFSEGRPLLASLIRSSDWLPEDCSHPHPDRYQQYLLYRDPQRRFSVVSFVWGPGQCTPVHDHTVWGMIGVLRGAERCEEFAAHDGGPLRTLGKHTLHAGDIEQLSPTIGDIHRVCNALDDDVSISIHVYGGDIGRLQRHVYDPDTGHYTAFVSGYS